MFSFIKAESGCFRLLPFSVFYPANVRQTQKLVPHPDQESLIRALRKNSVGEIPPESSGAIWKTGCLSDIFPIGGQSAAVHQLQHIRRQLRIVKKSVAVCHITVCRAEFCFPKNCLFLSEPAQHWHSILTMPLAWMAARTGTDSS